ncbi:MAG: radical SAM protein, partial [Crenarchaeota archaeon]|nr:radical SAM protein [Thermoproteota archaeon]
LPQLERELKKLDRIKPISVATSSAPYTPGEAQSLLMREVLPVFIRNGFKLLIVTKSNLVARDIDILSKGRVCVSVTVTTLNGHVAKRLEPFAPHPVSRLRMLEALSRAGIPTMIRLDPLIPGVNDDSNSIRAVIKAASAAGVRHVTTSTYKAKPDNFKRVLAAFPELEEELKNSYSHGERLGRSTYMAKRLRRELILKVREAAEEFSMGFATCREGFQDLNTAATCDGSHML